MTSKEIVHVSGGLTPEQFKEEVDIARQSAYTLQDIVENEKWYAMIQGNKHLNIQAWQAIGIKYRLTARTADTDIIYHPQTGAMLGVKARVEIIDQDAVVHGEGHSYCTYDEEETRKDGTKYRKWQGRPLANLSGMAQTRAASRGFKQILSWVVVLAGYSPTPAEEMQAFDNNAKSTEPVDEGDPLTYCPLHNVNWFMKGKMRDFAHPMEDGSWCNRRSAWGSIFRNASDTMGWSLSKSNRWIMEQYGKDIKDMIPEEQAQLVEDIVAMSAAHLRGLNDEASKGPEEGMQEAPEEDTLF